MKCPKCNKNEIRIGNKNITQEVKGETIEFVAEANICGSCKFSFLNNEQADRIALVASNGYRERKGLLRSDQIITFRKHLKMSQQEFADFIPVGIASVKRWEGVGIQDSSMDQLIRLKCDPVFSSRAGVIADEHLNSKNENGNRKFSREKMKELSKIMLKECMSPLYANKGIFYTDFYHFKKYGISITGSIYRKQEHGPVPLVAKDIFRDMEFNNEIRKKNTSGHDLEVVVPPNLNLFDDKEKETIVEVLKFIKKLGYKKLVDISHQEEGWLKTAGMEVISYAFSKTLKIKCST